MPKFNKISLDKDNYHKKSRSGGGYTIYFSGDVYKDGRLIDKLETHVVDFIFARGRWGKKLADFIEGLPESYTQARMEGRKRDIDPEVARDMKPVRNKMLLQALREGGIDV